MYRIPGKVSARLSGLYSGNESYPTIPVTWLEAAGSKTEMYDLRYCNIKRLNIVHIPKF